MRKDLKKIPGFTLVELLVVVSVLGILATISIAQYRKFTLKAKTTEAKTNIGAMRVLEESYFALHDAFIACGPTTLNGGDQVGSDPGEYGPGPDLDGDGIPEFQEIGFQPMGSKIYYTYQIVINDQGSEMCIDAKGDLDGDGELSFYSLNTDGVLAGGQSGNAPSAPFRLEHSGDDF